MTRGGTPFIERASVDKCRSLLCLLTAFQLRSMRAGEDAKGVARSGFPRAAHRQNGSSAACGSAVLRACSRDLIRDLAVALLCLNRWDSLPVSTM